MKLNRILCLMFAAAVLAGCTGSDVDIVKEGVMGGYQTTTVGAAFDASFDNPKWSEFKGEKGERVVEFTGLIKKPVLLNLTELDAGRSQPFQLAMYGKFVLTEPEYQQVYEGASQGGTVPEKQVAEILFEAACDKIAGSPAVFQWIVTPDGKSFSLSYVDAEAWGCYVGKNGTPGDGYVFKDVAILDAIYN